MPLRKEDIEPDITTILDPEVLLADRRIKYWGAMTFRVGLFLCVQVVKEKDLRFSITRRSGSYLRRIELRGRWQPDGNPV